MSVALHSEIKHSAYYNDKLQPVQEFARAISQCRTSLGLGSSFVKDSMARGDALEISAEVDVFQPTGVGRDFR